MAVTIAMAIASAIVMAMATTSVMTMDFRSLDGANKPCFPFSTLNV